MRFIVFLSFFFISYSSINAQNVKLEGVTYIMPSAEGDIECVILTKNDFQELQAKLTALSNGNSGNNAINSEWDIFKQTLNFYSVSKFNTEYTEKELVTIANTRELLPDWLKSTKGKKADKVTWFQENKNEIDKY